MYDLQNIALTMVKFSIPFLVGSLIFFSAIVAPTTFINLDQKNARKFIRNIFPKLYMWAHLLSLIIALLLIFYDFILGAITLMVSFGFLFSRQYLVKWINAISDVKIKNKQQQKRFNLLHSLSVMIFISQIICLSVIYFYV